MSEYAARRVATVTDPEPVVVKPAWPIGTRMTLEGEDGPWSLIEVCGAFDNGPDLGIEPIVRPVEVAAGHDCSPRKVSPDAIVSLGYVVEDMPTESEEWATGDPAEVPAMPFETYEAESKAAE